MTKSLPHKAMAVAALLLSACVIGCSCEVQVGDDSGSAASDVESALPVEFEELTGVELVSVDCPEEMLTEDGRTYECVIVHPTDGEQAANVTMHDDGDFDWSVSY